MEAYSHSLKASPACEMCGDTGTAVTWQCIECEQSCCVSCAQTHTRIKATQSHVIIPIGQKVLAPEKMCSTHKDEKLRFYCQGCRLVICRDCKLTQHEGHATRDISQISGDARNTLQEVMPLLHTKLRPVLDAILQEAHQHKSNVLQKKKKIASSLVQRADLLKAEIDACLAKAQQELSTESGDAEQAVDAGVKEMAAKLETLGDLITRTEQVLDRGGCADVLQIPRQIGEFIRDGEISQAFMPPCTSPLSSFDETASQGSAMATRLSRSLSVSRTGQQAQSFPQSILEVFAISDWRVDLQLTSQSMQQWQRQPSFSYRGIEYDDYDDYDDDPYPGDVATGQAFTVPESLKTQIGSCLGTVVKVPSVHQRCQIRPGARFGLQIENRSDALVNTVSDIQRRLSEWV